MLKFKTNGLTKVLAVISAFCIIFSLFAAVPFVIKAENTEKMFVIKPTEKNGENFTYANVFIPLNFRETGGVVLKGNTYFKLTFKARNFGKGRPIVGVIRANYKADGSFSEKDYAYNNLKREDDDTNLTCSYDPSTYTYTYIIKLPIADAYSSSPDKSHSAITIGNMEHNDGWYSENCPETYFAFAEPMLYAYDISTKETYGDNLIAGINDSTVDISKTYNHKSNPYTANDSLLMAPANKWGIDTTASLIEYKDIPKDYFDASKHNYIKHDAVAPTETESGNKEYYTCDCEDCKGKYFINNGAVEVEFDELYIQPNGPDKAIIIKPNNKGDEYPSSVFIPLDFGEKNNGKVNYYLLKFKTNIVDGNMPIIGVVRNDSKLGGSFSEPDYAYNNQGENPDAKKLYAKYDEETKTYSAVIKVDLNENYCNSKTGSYAAITIGKAEHNGNWYGENDFDSSFIIYQPELYRYNVITKKPYKDEPSLIAGINNNSVDLENSYTHRKNPYTSSDNLMNAPKDIWSVDGPTRYVSVADVPEDFFAEDKHNYIKHNAVEPTEDKEGSIEYYTCDCEDCKDKYFTNFGLTEIKDGIKIAPNGEEQMIVISPNNSGATKFANVFIPVDFRTPGDPLFGVQTKYYRLSFKIKLLGDSMPVVSVIRYDNGSKGSWSEPEYVYNNNEAYWDESFPALFSSYDEETMTYTALIALKMDYGVCSSESGAHHAIMIGNAERNGNWYKENAFETSFAFYAPELYLYDAQTKTVSGENLLPGINNNTLNLDDVYTHDKNPCTLPNNIMSAPIGKWSVDTTKSMISTYEIDESYFDSSIDSSNMLKVVGGNDKSLLENKSILKTDTQYKIDFDYKVSDGASVNCGLYVLDGSENMIDLTRAGGKSIIPDDNIDGTHFSRIISMPTTGINTFGDNFKIVIGVESDSDDSVAYIANVKIRSLSANGNYGNNILLNGDFSFEKAGTVDIEKHLVTWNVGDSSNYKTLETESIPDDMFKDTTPNAIYINGLKGNITTFTSINAGKTYLFRYKSKYTGDAIAEPYIEFLNNSESSIIEVSVVRDNDGYYNTVCEFTAPKDLASGKNLRIGIKGDSTDINAVISKFELYELDTAYQITGENLISDSTFIDNATMVEYSKDLDIGIWMKEIDDGKVEIKSVGLTYFDIIKSQMMLFVGTNKNGGEGKITQEISLERNKKYQLSLNVKYADVGVEGDKLGAELQYKQNGGFKSLDYEKTESDTEYLETYTFTIPSNASKDKNFRLSFHFSSAYTSGYASNFELYELDNDGEITGENLVQNGDFATGGIDHWKKSGYYFRMEFNETPENFFSKVIDSKPNMIIYRNPDDYAELDYSPSLKPATSYELRYKALHTDYIEEAPPHVAFWQYYYNDKNIIVNSSIPNVKTVADGNITSKFFTTSERLAQDGNNNIIIRLYMRSASAGYWGAVELYELDENGKRVSNNLIVNGDFSSGIKCWDKLKSSTIRIVEEPDGFFENWKKSDEMIYSNGTKSNQSYGQDLKVKSGKKYYYSGFYISMNSEGVKPKIKYLPRSAVGTDNYKELDIDVFYDSDRYFFEVEFEIPDDALIVNGFASIYVEINNGNKGMGYFTDIMLCEEGKYINLLSNLTFKDNGNYQKMPYDAGVFIFYYDDEKFDDGDWSGEWENSKYNIKYGKVSGRIVDENGIGVPNLTVQLNPGEITTKTDEYGNYSFDSVEPGTYKLSVIEDNGNPIYCLDVEVRKGIWSMVTMITYHPRKVIVLDNPSDNTSSEQIPTTDDNTSSEQAPTTDDNVSSEQAPTTDNNVSSEQVPTTDENISSEQIPNVDDNTSSEQAPIIEDSVSSDVTTSTEDTTVDNYFTNDSISSDTNNYIDSYPQIDVPVIEEIPEEEMNAIVGESDANVGLLRGLYYKADGSMIAGATIYLRNHGSAVTDGNGVFMFENIIPGDYEVYAILADGSEYVFRTVSIKANKGFQISIVEPAKENENNNTWLIVIIASSIVLLTGVVIAIILIKKRKAKKL